jgi:putative hydrolase of the HAD superfamily
VALDFGGVVAEEGFLALVREMAAELGRPEEALIEAAETALRSTGYLVGRGDEAVFLADFAARGGLDPAKLISFRERVLERYPIRPGMLALVDRLRDSGVRVVVASDQTDWLEELDRRRPFYDRFDRVFNSYRFGRTKSEAAFFEEMARELGVKPREILFVDDRPVNVEVARSVGCTGLVFRDEDQFQLEFMELLL